MLNQDASGFYQEIESVPQFPQGSSSQVSLVSQAIVSTFHSAKLFKMDQDFVTASKNLDMAARCLKLSDGEEELTEEELIMKNCMLLACDWQLNARTKLWQSRLHGNAVSS